MATLNAAWQTSYFFSFSLGYFYSVGYFSCKKNNLPPPMGHIS